MSYRPWLEKQALRQMGGLPAEALDLLARVIARIRIYVLVWVG